MEMTMETCMDPLIFPGEEAESNGKVFWKNWDWRKSKT